MLDVDEYGAPHDAKASRPVKFQFAAVVGLMDYPQFLAARPTLDAYHLSILAVLYLLSRP